MSASPSGAKMLVAGPGAGIAACMTCPIRAMAASSACVTRAAAGLGKPATNC